MENAMSNQDLNKRFLDLSTPLVADACLRLEIPFRVAGSGIRPLTGEGTPQAGRALPVRHYGSVDIFLEAMGTARRGDVLIIDNGGRMDEGCIGDLTVLEARACGLAAIIVWGCHRDTPELLRIGFPVFSCGQYPAGPRRLDPWDPEALLSARVGGLSVTNEDIVFADEDGILFVPERQVGQVLTTARSIWEKERRQAQAILAGRKLREQLRFDDYLAKRSADASYTFRRHLRAIGGAIEE